MTILNLARRNGGQQTDRVPLKVAACVGFAGDGPHGCAEVNDHQETPGASSPVPVTCPPSGQDRSLSLGVCVCVLNTLLCSCCVHTCSRQCLGAGSVDERKFTSPFEINPPGTSTPAPRHVSASGQDQSLLCRLCVYILHVVPVYALCRGRARFRCSRSARKRQRRCR